ncbi:MAG: peptidoglycan-binding protein [Candidatus Rokuibacteriota bacterium]
MDRWRSIFAFAVAGALVASPVLAQTGSSTSPQTGSEQSKPADAPKPDAAKPSDSSAPAASPRTSGSDASKDAPKSGATKPDAAKSDAMKSDTMKSDTMKSDTMKSDPMKSAGGNRAQVRSAQQALKDKGHDPGSIDGVMGPQTQAALKDFQKAQGLKETGRLDAETMAQLGVDTAAAASPRSSDPSASPGGSAPTQSSKDPTTPAKRPQAR